MGHTTWAAEGREGRYQASPKGRNLEVGPRRGAETFSNKNNNVLLVDLLVALFKNLSDINFIVSDM